MLIHGVAKSDTTRFKLAFPPKSVSKLLALQANGYKQALLGPHLQQ